MNPTGQGSENLDFNPKITLAYRSYGTPRPTFCREVYCPAMTSMSIPFLTLFLFLGAQVRLAVAQDTRVVTVPEKVMAARLQNYETPLLSKPPLANRCSNALAVVHVVVDVNGNVSSADYVSGFPELESPALAAVRRWSYKPYSVDGRPVIVDTKASVFYLGDGESIPMYVPDQKGGTKGGNMIPLPPGCGKGPQIKRQN